MKKILFALALFAAAPAFSASPCNIPGLPKIAGLDYHTARAKLINAGFLPSVSFPDKAITEDRGISALPISQFGYSELLECSTSSFSACAFKWKTKSGKIFYTVSADSENKFLVIKTTCD